MSLKSSWEYSLFFCVSWLRFSSKRKLLLINLHTSFMRSFAYNWRSRESKGWELLENSSKKWDKGGLFICFIYTQFEGAGIIIRTSKPWQFYCDQKARHKCVDDNALNRYQGATTIEVSLFHLGMCGNVVSTWGYKWVLANVSMTRNKIWG